MRPEIKNCPMTETEKKAVGRYLDWHTGILLETDGKMGIYRKESGKLRYIQAKQDGYAWNVRNCMDYMKEK